MESHYTLRRASNFHFFFFKSFFSFFFFLRTHILIDRQIVCLIFISKLSNVNRIHFHTTESRLYPLLSFRQNITYTKNETSCVLFLTVLCWVVARFTSHESRSIVSQLEMAKVSSRRPTSFNGNVLVNLAKWGQETEWKEFSESIKIESTCPRRTFGRV